MNKIEFLEQLEARLKGISVVDRVRSLDYFSEIIDDCMENGMSEEDAVASLGEMEEIAANIRREAPESPLRHEESFTNTAAHDAAAGIECDFSSVRVRVRESEVRVLRSEDGESRVDCVDTEKVYHRVFTENGVLNVETVDERRWYERFGSFGGRLEVRIYLPAGRYDALDIETMSGGVSTERGIEFGKVSIQTMSGEIVFLSGVHELLEAHSMSGSISAEGDNELSSATLNSKSGALRLCGFRCEANALLSSISGGIRATGVTARNCTAKSVSGAVMLKETVAVCRLSASTTSGSIKFEGCDANRVELDSVSGSIRGSLATGKQFSARSLSGSIRLPQNNREQNGECRAKTVSGSINIALCE